MVPTTINLKNFNNVIVRTKSNVIVRTKSHNLRLKSQYSCVGITAMPCIGGNQNVQTEEAGDYTGGNLIGRHRNEGAQGA